MARTERARRIERMYRRDVAAAWLFVAVLWAVLAFVGYATWNLAPNDEARWLLLASGALVLLFNSLAIAAMLAHYANDKAFIYGLDLKHLDDMRRGRRM